MLVVGWGLLPITMFHFIPLLFSALSWRELLPLSSRPDVVSVTWIRWIRESINSLLPVAGVFVGALPVVLLAGASSFTSAVVVAIAFMTPLDRYRRAVVGAPGLSVPGGRTGSGCTRPTGGGRGAAGTAA